MNIQKSSHPVAVAYAPAVLASDVAVLAYKGKGINKSYCLLKPPVINSKAFYMLLVKNYTSKQLKCRAIENRRIIRRFIIRLI